MTPEQMKKIVDNAPKTAEEWRTNGFYYRCNGKYYWCAFSEQWFESLSWNTFKRYTIANLRTELARHDTLDLEPSDIPHGTIVLEK